MQQIIVGNVAQNRRCLIVLWVTVQVYCFVRVPDAEIMDDITFTLPIMKEMGDQVHMTAKVVKPLALI